jgi:hypothetical protein
MDGEPIGFGQKPERSSARFEAASVALIASQQAKERRSVGGVVTDHLDQGRPSDRLEGSSARLAQADDGTVWQLDVDARLGRATVTAGHLRPPSSALGAASAASQRTSRMFSIGKERRDIASNSTVRT